MWKREPGGVSVYDDVPEVYDLATVVEEARVDTSGGNDISACRYVRSLLSMDSGILEVKKGVEVKLLKDLLTPILTSTTSKPDVSVFSKDTEDFPLVLCEVHSSPYICTVIKCITVVSELVQLHRLHNQSVTCTGLVFPKFGSKTCVTKVCVQWHLFKLSTTCCM